MMAATHGKKGIVYKWNGTASNLSAEACTESGSQAQITDSAKRILNPNADITFTDSGGANVIRIDHVTGTAYFDANVTSVTVTGTSAYLTSATLIKTGYLYDWTLDAELELSEKTVFQDDWKSWLAGLGSVKGSAEGYFAGINWWDDIEDVADGTMALFLLQLFTYDPDDDHTGDHFNVWAHFKGYGVDTNIGKLVTEKIEFTGYGRPGFEVNF